MMIWLLLTLLIILPVVLVYWSIVKSLSFFNAESTLTLAYCFIWGGIIAVVFSMAWESAFIEAFGGYLDQEGIDFFSTVLFAPLIEELFKGFGILILFLIALNTRKGLRGPLSGLVYGGIIGLGFALSEDIGYMMSAAEDSGLLGILLTYFGRVILLGLSHTTYTAVIGLGFGYAIVSDKKLKRVIYPLIGLAAAVSLHFIRNLLVTTLNTYGIGFVLAVILNLIVILLFFGLILFFALKERKAAMQGLGGVIGEMLTLEEFNQIITKKNLIPFYNYYTLSRLSSSYNLTRQKQLSLLRLGLIRHRKKYEKIDSDASCHVTDTTYLELHNRIEQFNLDNVKLVSESNSLSDMPLTESIHPSTKGEQAIHLLILKNEETGKSISIKINSTIGRSVCKKFGDESKFLGEHQYKLIRDYSGWLIVPNDETINMTLLNGKSIDGEQLLKNRDTITVGNVNNGFNKLPLVVHLST
jgi:protease PrsW